MAHCDRMENTSNAAELFDNYENCKNCEKPCDPYDKPSLICSGGCDKRVHIECLKRGIVPASFVGDVFFEFNCSSCNSAGEEIVTRDRMPWLNVIVLTLYNLREKSSGISKRGYFHWKSDISSFVDRNWDYIFKKTVKRKKNWIGTISGTLSHYSGIFFKSGTSELGESGWWRLLDNDPPEILIAKNNKMLMERKRHIGTKLSYRCDDIPALSDSDVSFREDSDCREESIKIQDPSMYSRAYVQPTETLSDVLFEEDEPTDTSNENLIPLRDEFDFPSISDLIRDCQYQHGNLRPTTESSTDNHYEWLRDITYTPDCADHQDIKVKGEEYDEDSNDSRVSVQEQPPVSLFRETNRRRCSHSKILAGDEKITRMTRQEEVYLLQRVNKADLDGATNAIGRFYRKLVVRKRKREYGLPLLDIDRLGVKSEATAKPSRNNDRVLDRFLNGELECIFDQRLQGYNEPTCVHSPYTNRILKPFIRQDTQCQPLWLRVMRELCAKANKNNGEWKAPPRAPIDYCYVRPQHIPAINSLCSQFFWPGIDLAECLQYPDFTCVALYKKLIVGFAILVPDVGYNEAYISFILTRPEWRKCGIAKFMLYHLIQTCMGRDLTLHVSATNTALLLYQKFGFKVEEYIQDFYDKYMPPTSRECRHAFFLRLSR